MLLAASPHSNESQNPDDYDALSTTNRPTKVLTHLAPTDPEPNGEEVISSPPSAARVPTHAIHTPQQLAQLEAIARAQSREKPESTLVTDDEKYLAAQLVYLASQHHGSEYNRQKPFMQGGPTAGSPGVYIPLSIQLPTHVSELRTRQEKSLLRQAWFIAPPREEESSYDDLPEQIDETQGAEDTENEIASRSLPGNPTPSQSNGHASYLQPESIQVDLLQDALGNSMFSTPQAASVLTEETTKLPPTALSLLTTQPVLRVLPSAFDPDAVETPPPLAEATLPQFPSPARSRAPSQNMTVRPANLPDLLAPPSNGRPSVPDNLRQPSPAIAPKPNYLLAPDDRPILWPPPPSRPPPVHVSPAPSPQLQLALETAISKDMIIDPSQLSLAHPIMHGSLGISDIPLMQAPRGFYGPPSPAQGSPGAGMRPPIFIPPGFAVPKTSETHPINISQVIPSEYLAAISTHLEAYPPSKDEKELEMIISRGSYFRIDPSFRLDRIIYVLTARAIEARAAMARYSPIPVRVKFAEGVPVVGPALFTGPGVRASTSEPNFDRPLKRPLAMTPPITFPTAPSAKRMEPSPAEQPRAPDSFAPNMLNLDLQGSNPSPLNAHPPTLILPEVPATITNGNPTNNSITDDIEQAHTDPPTPIVLPTLPPLSHTVSSPPSAMPQCTPITPFQSLPNLHSPSPGTWTPPQSKGDFMLGNLYLSSCPGKKVRLSGPIKGRGAICRNLGADLARVKSTGVYLVVCCLDDDEMEFLGAPWPEYKEAAATIGLDVLRLPMPEGLCPLSVQAMAQHMDRIIHNYTLKGRHVLVHCRGGVGRAGLVACTWMLKLGICGSVEINSDDHYTIQDPTVQPPAEALMQDRKVPRDSLELLERVIYIIRRQRSVKAIETYEQVRFLLEFIEYLRDTDARVLAAHS